MKVTNFKKLTADKFTLTAQLVLITGINDQQAKAKVHKLFYLETLFLLLRNNNRPQSINKSKNLKIWYKSY